MNEQLTVRETLPPKRGADTIHYDWDQVAAECRADPGEWRLVFHNDRASLATAIRIHGIKVLDPYLGFEVTTRNNTRGEPRMCSMWVRWNPAKGG